MNAVKNTTKGEEGPAIGPVRVKKGENVRRFNQATETKKNDEERGRTIKNNQVGFMLLCTDNDLTCLLERSDPITYVLPIVPKGVFKINDDFGNTHAHTDKPSLPETHTHKQC